MYDLTLSYRDRARAFVLVILVHAAVIGGLLMLAPGRSPSGTLQRPLEVFDVVLPELTPPPPKPRVVESRAAQKKEGASAPPATKAEASPVKRVEPQLVLAAPPPPIVIAPTPSEGSAPSAGAAPVDGPASGAGGQGNGTGSGGAGSGPGGGGDGGAASRPSLSSRPLTQRDYRSENRRAWPSGQRVLVTFDVLTNGRASDCKVFQSSGVPSIDAETCALVIGKLRFRPARDEDGRPIVARYGYAQVAQF